MLDKSTILTGNLPFQSYPSANFQLWYKISQNSKKTDKIRLDILKDRHLSVIYRRLAYPGYIYQKKQLTAICQRFAADWRTRFQLSIKLTAPWQWFAPNWRNLVSSTNKTDHHFFFFFFNYFESTIFYIKQQITFFVLSSYTFCIS